jgi:AcrR family transcriptional regulator
MSRLSREDWARAALEAIGAGGIAAVAVEPLATRLGTTKGSFYWHFRNRDELVAAALELWRQVSTTAVIARLEADGAPPATRLRQLVSQVFTAQAGTSADLPLLAHAEHPLVAPILADVTEQRLAYVTRLFRQLGFPAADARRRAMLAYSAYLGHLQLLRSGPGLLPAPGPAASAYADEVLATLLAPPTSTAEAATHRTATS